MATARVIDLTKNTAQVQGEKFNQQVKKAKESVSETLDLLFSKDAQFRPLEKPAPSAAEPSKTETVTASSLSEIKIGEIKLKGKIQLPSRKLILDERQLGDLRSNLALFTC